MNVDGLKALYSANECARRLLDHMAGRERNQRVTKLKVVLRRLRSDGTNIRKSDLIGAFRELEKLDCGRYIEGRHGHDSRFDWEITKSLVASKAAQGGEADPELETDEIEETYDYDVLDYSFYLREDFQLTITLPVDLSDSEAKRLANFVETLPLEDFDEESE